MARRALAEAEGVDAMLTALVTATPRAQQTSALSAKGSELLASGDADVALACFDRALRIDANAVSAWVGRATVLAVRKRDNEALGCVQRALDIDPQCADALVQKGHILRARGLYLDALAIYDAALASSPSEAARAGRAAVLSALGRPEATRGAVRSARRSDEAPPTSRRSTRKSGSTDPPAAKKGSERPTPKRSSPPASNPPNLSQEQADVVTLDEVRALCLASHFLDALRKLEPLAKRRPESREAWTLRAHILFSLQHHDAALKSVEHVLKTHPRDQDALELIVKLLAATGKDVRALEMAERLVAVAPAAAHVHRLRADCLVAAMRHGDAVVAYERALEGATDDPSAWIALGRTLRQLRRVGESREALRKGLSLAEGTSHELAAQARELLAKLPRPEH